MSETLNFEYKGIQQGKYIEGVVDAISSDEASFKLKKQKIIITSLEELKPRRKKGNPRRA